MRLCTFNIKHAEIAGLAAIERELRATQADVIALQEVDARTTRAGGVHQAESLGAALGLHAAFAPAFSLEGGHYGVALLSSWPITAQAPIFLPRCEPPRDEARVALGAQTGGWHFFVTHLSLDGDERALQARALAARIGEGAEKAICCGDFNESVAAPGVRALLATGLRDAWSDCGAGEQITAAPDRPRERVDLVLLGTALHATNVEVRPTTASDHPLVIVEIA